MIRIKKEQPEKEEVKQENLFPFSQKSRKKNVLRKEWSTV